MTYDSSSVNCLVIKYLDMHYFYLGAESLVGFNVILESCLGQLRECSVVVVNTCDIF